MLKTRTANILFLFFILLVFLSFSIHRTKGSSSKKDTADCVKIHQHGCLYGGLYG